MLNLYSANSKFSNSIDFKFFDITYSVTFDTYLEGDDLFISEIQYYGPKEDIILNGYLNLLIKRGVEVLDRISIKELDYFLRQDNKTPYFDKISPELMKILELGEKIKTKFSISKSKSFIIYNPEVHGPFDLMSYGEKLELIEEAFASDSLKSFQLECIDYDDINLKITSPIKIIDKDILYIESELTKLLRQKIKVIYDV